MLLRLCAVAVLVQICSSFSIKAIERRSLLSSRYSEVQTKKEIGYLENRCLWSTSSPLDAPVSVSSPEKVSTSSYPILVLCCAIAAVCALDRVVMSIAILPMGVEYTYSDSTKGAIAAFFSLGYMVGLVPSGIASATTSPKKVWFRYEITSSALVIKTVNRLQNSFIHTLAESSCILPISLQHYYPHYL